VLHKKIRNAEFNKVRRKATNVAQNVRGGYLRPQTGYFRDVTRVWAPKLAASKRSIQR